MKKFEIPELEIIFFEGDLEGKDNIITSDDDEGFDTEVP